MSVEAVLVCCVVGRGPLGREVCGFLCLCTGLHAYPQVGGKQLRDEVKEEEAEGAIMVVVVVVEGWHLHNLHNYFLGRSDGLVSALDLLPTVASLTGLNTSGLTLDGMDISPLLWDPHAVVSVCLSSV